MNLRISPRVELKMADSRYAAMNYEMSSESATGEQVQLDFDQIVDPPIKNQTMALISVVGPTCAQKCSQYAMMIRGVAGTQEALDLIRDKVYAVNKQFDLYQVPIGQLVPLAFDEKDLGADGFAEKRLATIMSELKENHERAETEFAKHRELLKRGKRDPKDIEIMLEAIAEQRKKLDEQEALAKEALEKAQGEAAAA